MKVPLNNGRSSVISAILSVNCNLDRISKVGKYYFSNMNGVLLLTSSHIKSVTILNKYFLSAITIKELLLFEGG